MATKRYLFLKSFRNLYSVSCVFFTLISAGGVFGIELSDLHGEWKHREKPVWIKIVSDNDSGSGIIIKNEDDSSSVGKFLFIELSPEIDYFSGQIYVPQLGRFHPMKAEVANAGEIKVLVKVGFIRKTVFFDKTTI